MIFASLEKWGQIWHLFYLFIQHLLSALFTNKYALINTLQNKYLLQSPYFL